MQDTCAAVRTVLSVPYHRARSVRTVFWHTIVVARMRSTSAHQVLDDLTDAQGSSQVATLNARVARFEEGFNDYLRPVEMVTSCPMTSSTRLWF